ncbi:MAG: O-antigen ligase family protein, partial [Gaiellaceae bacterium]
KLTFFASFVIVFYLIVSLIRSLEDLDFLVKVLVVGGSVLAIFAAVEASTGYNVFNNLSGFVPILGQPDIPYTLLHPTGRLRVYASAENPIALAAVFVMLIPLSVYLALSSGNRRWWGAACLLLMGAVSSVSRTAIVMLAIVVLVMLRTRPAGLRRLWIGIVPLLLALHFALPGALGSLSSRFSPQGGLVAQQSQGTGSTGSGRLAHLGPGFREFGHRPLLGGGFGSRVTDGPTPNASILDDQWLGTLLETGALGALAWLWFFGRYTRRLARLAKEDMSAEGTLAAALVASVASLAVGWFFFDSLSFAQVTFLLFILLAIGSSVLALRRQPQEEGLLARGGALSRVPAWASRVGR